MRNEIDNLREITDYQMKTFGGHKLQHQTEEAAGDIDHIYLRSREYPCCLVFSGAMWQFRLSIRIMNTFVEMRRFITNNALLFEKVSNIELKQLEYQKSTDERFDKVFQYIEDHAESEQKIGKRE